MAEIEELVGEYDELSLANQVNRLRRYFVHNLTVVIQSIISLAHSFYSIQCLEKYVLFRCRVNRISISPLPEHFAGKPVR